MEITDIKTLITDFESAIIDKNFQLINNIFNNVDLVIFDGAEFPESEETLLNLVLGIENDTLIGFLVQDSANYADWTPETKIYKAEFRSKSSIEYPDFSENYTISEISEHENYISEELAASRLIFWEETKNDWIEENLNSGDFVRFFEIPKATFDENSPNYFKLARREISNTIDLIIENNAGLYDTVRPVPPFPPKTKWPVV